jgi:excisionase family DNA binding protein
LTATASEHLLTVRDVADQLGVSERSVRRYIHDRKLWAVKLGDGPQAPVRVEPAELERFVAKGARRGYVRSLMRGIDEKTRERSAAA